MKHLAQYNAPPADERFVEIDAAELAAVLHRLHQDLAHPALADRVHETNDEIGVATRAAELMDSEGATILMARDEDGLYFARPAAGRTIRLTGEQALNYWLQSGGSLNKSADPTEDVRYNLTAAEAREIMFEDARLLWIDAETKRYGVVVIGCEDGGKTTLDGPVAFFDSLEPAKLLAHNCGSAHYFGVAVVDMENSSVDLGEGWEVFGLRVRKPLWIAN